MHINAFGKSWLPFPLPNLELELNATSNLASLPNGESAEQLLVSLTVCIAELELDGAICFVVVKAH
jgi:hypothetical protein